MDFHRAEQATLPTARRSEKALRPAQIVEAASALASTDEAAEDTPHAFSATRLRDRVAIMLLFNQVVEVEQVEEEWRRGQQQASSGNRPVLWRALAERPDVDRERAFEIAALVFGYDEVEFAFDEAVAFVRSHASAFAAEQWTRLAQLPAVPVRTEKADGNGEGAWIFAAPDPARVKAEGLLETFVGAFSLGYAPARKVHGVLDEAFSFEPAQAEGADAQAPVEPPEPLPSAAEDGAPHGEAVPAEEQADASAPETAQVLAKPSVPDLMDFFKQVLTDGTRLGASEIRLLPTEQKRTQVRFDGAPERRGLGGHFGFGKVAAFFEEHVIRPGSEGQDDAASVAIQCEIDGSKERFRIAVGAGREGNANGTVVITALG